VTESHVLYSGGAGEPSSGLLERVKGHDQPAWERLVGLYTPLVYRWCRSGGVEVADVEDVGQEVFQAVARKVRDFHRDRAGDSFLGWLRTITRHKVHDYLRVRAGQAVGEGGSDALTQLQQVPAPPEDSSGSCPPEEAQLLYRRAVELIRADFNEQTWEAFRRVVLEGRSAAEVAAELGVTVNVVYLAKSRVLKRLHDEFAGLIEA
jgi:RNA polymerase sigma-70 factor (ECF subfamily)